MMHCNTKRLNILQRYKKATNIGIHETKKLDLTFISNIIRIFARRNDKASNIYIAGSY